MVGLWNVFMKRSAWKVWTFKGCGWNEWIFDIFTIVIELEIFWQLDENVVETSELKFSKAWLCILIESWTLELCEIETQSSVIKLHQNLRYIHQVSLQISNNFVQTTFLNSQTFDSLDYLLMRFLRENLIKKWNNGSIFRITATISVI